MDRKSFNDKYENWLVEGHYGLDLANPIAIEYLDGKFQEYIKLPDFKYKQIKSKFNWFCFYADGLSRDELVEVERKLKEIYNVQTV
jgi:hypothetical protein